MAVWPRLLRLAIKPACSRQGLSRSFHVLGIETSADDTCTALMEVQGPGMDRISLRHVLKVTCPNQKHKGIHPVEAVVSHTKHLSQMVRKATALLKPDLICVTRGPGMGGCLSVGVTTAKALADVWQVPIVGVHHMQAHALTHLMDAALPAYVKRSVDPNSWPKLTLLVTGKHTMLLHSTSQSNHRILVSTKTTALGDVLDKIARELVPPSFIPTELNAVCYPFFMERWLGGGLAYGYKAPTSRQEEIAVYQYQNSWQLAPPLRDTRALEYNFTSLCSRVQTILLERPMMSDPERRELGRQTFRLAFEHLMSRVLLALETDEELKQNPPKALVLSGGVAKNSSLSLIADKMLRARGYSIPVVQTKPIWCTDNAPMIAFTGYMMYKDGWQTDNSFAPATKWSIEEILTGVDGWVRRDGFPPVRPEALQAAQPASNAKVATSEDEIPFHPEDVTEDVTEQQVAKANAEDTNTPPPDPSPARPSSTAPPDETHRNRKARRRALKLAPLWKAAPAASPQSPPSSTGKGQTLSEAPNRHAEVVLDQSIKVWPEKRNASERDAVKVRFLGHENEPPPKKDVSLAGKIANVFSGWFGGK